MGLKCIVVYDIDNDDDRERLRNELSNLGFTRLQKSAYIKDCEECKKYSNYFKSLGISGKIDVFCCNC